MSHLKVRSVPSIVQKKQTLAPISELEETEEILILLIDSETRENHQSNKDKVVTEEQGAKLQLEKVNWSETEPEEDEESDEPTPSSRKLNANSGEAVDKCSSRPALDAFLGKVTKTCKEMMLKLKVGSS